MLQLFFEIPVNASHIITKENSRKPAIRNLRSRAYIAIAKKATIHMDWFSIYGSTRQIYVFAGIENTLKQSTWIYYFHGSLWKLVFFQCFFPFLTTESSFGRCKTCFTSQLDLFSPPCVTTYSENFSGKYHWRFRTIKGIANAGIKSITKAIT